MRNIPKGLTVVLLIISIAVFLTTCGGGTEDGNSNEASNNANILSMKIWGTDISRDQNNPTPLWYDTLTVGITFDRELTQAEKDSIEVSYAPNCVDCPIGTTIWGDGEGFSLVTIGYFLPSGNVCISQCSGTVTTIVSGTKIKTTNFYWSH